MDQNDMSKLPGNARISKDISEETVNSVKVRTAASNKSFGDRIVDNLFNTNGVDMPTYIFDKVVWPGICGIISDTVGSICDNFKHGVNALLYRRKDSPSERVRRGNGRHEDYGRFSRSGSDRDFDKPSYISEKADDIIDSLIFDSKGQAEEVRDYLCDIIEEYDEVSVRQLCTKLRIEGDFTMNNLGWYTLKDAKIYETHERNKHGEVETKWLLDLPKPIRMD